MPTTEFFVTCPIGIESLLKDELARLGVLNCHESKGGVAFHGDLETAYRVCLWSRIGSRVLMPLQTFEVDDAETIYAAGREIEWPDLLVAEKRFSINVAGRAPCISNSHFAALRLKDAIVDTFRERALPRPVVDTHWPDFRLHLHLNRRLAQISLDLSGESLHRRGYRARRFEAPLKENLACAILAYCHWTPNPHKTSEAFGIPENSHKPLAGAFYDPMCGSGTFLIEGAWIAADVAPAILRQRWGFEAWKAHEPELWQKLLREAHRRRVEGLSKLKATFFGVDRDPKAISLASENIKRAGLSGYVRIEVGDALSTRPKENEAGGLVICNPPYGERMATEAELIKLYSMFGIAMKTHYSGWRLGFFTSRPALATRLGLRASGIRLFHNGAIPCKLLQFEIPVTSKHSSADLAGDLHNRLLKNKRHLSRWARRNDVRCYRVYDADLPDYAVAIDCYHLENGELHVCVQEYEAPRTVDAVAAEKRLRKALATILNTFEIAPAQLHYKLRKKQKNAGQYQKHGSAEQLHVVQEHGCRLQVNFDDYIDTGLFLDHRPIRLRLQSEARGIRVLNLFCYTGAATVHAAIGGATHTVSVDLSKTYLEWTRHNLQLNGHSAYFADIHPSGSMATPKHCLVRADCEAWLKKQAQHLTPPQFDRIFFDPPTFSNSKKVRGMLDIERDHSALLHQAMSLLAPNGVLYFSTNRRTFTLDTNALSDYLINNITGETLDMDFKRSRLPHRCWMLTHRINEVRSPETLNAASLK